MRAKTTVLGFAFLLLSLIIACTQTAPDVPTPVTVVDVSYSASDQALMVAFSNGSTIPVDLNDLITADELVGDLATSEVLPAPEPITIDTLSYSPATQLLTLTFSDGRTADADLTNLTTDTELSATLAALSAAQASLSPAPIVVRKASYNAPSQSLILTLSNGTTIPIDLSQTASDQELEAVVLNNEELVSALIQAQGPPTPVPPTVVSASYDPTAQMLYLTLTDGTTIRADLNTLITATELEYALAAIPATPIAVPTAVLLPAPIAVPTAVLLPAPIAVDQAGTFNFSVPEMGAPNFGLSVQNYQSQKTDGVTTHEAMFGTATDNNVVVPRLVTEWEVDPTGLVYTFHLRQGVPWHTNHGEWGEFHADDFIYTWQDVATPSALHPIAAGSRRTFTCEECQMVKLDDYTVQLTRPTPTIQITWHSRMPVGASLSFHSKNHYDAVGVEQDNRESVGTGPWMLTNATSGVDRRFEAVKDHWNKSPEFAEMIWHEIPEESTRLAIFLVGQIDTGSFTLESIQAIRNENRDDFKYMTFPGAVGLYLNLLGQQYYTDHPHHQPNAEGYIRVPLDDNAFDCSFPWVSCDRDTTTEEWDKARKVRQAMNHAIDRQKLVNNLAFGEGQPLFHIWWPSHEQRMIEYGLDQLTFAYDPEFAKQLLIEAGYPDGFEIDMALTVRPSPGAVENGESVCTMWLQVDIRCNSQVRPFSEFRPTLVSRAAKGAITQATVSTFEPLRTMQIRFNSTNFINFGLEHPDWQDMMDDALATVDEDERWRKQGAMTAWLHEHAMTIVTYSANQVFPLGPEIDAWKPMAGTYDWLSNFEFVPHRQ